MSIFLHKIPPFIRTEAKIIRSVQSKIYATEHHKNPLPSAEFATMKHEASRRSGFAPVGDSPDFSKSLKIHDWWKGWIWMEGSVVLRVPGGKS